VLILDEPTSSLDEAEVQTLFGVLRRLREEGMAILFVTHFLEQTYAISDRITVMRNGEREGEYACADLSRLALVNKMIGAAADSGELAQAEEAPTRHEAGAVFLAARGIARKGVLSPVDLEVRRGELLGLAGLLGSGRTETARLLFGADKADQGSIEVGGKPHNFANPRDAIRQGIAFCSEDRKHEGAILPLSVRENVVLALQARQGIWRAIPMKRQQQLASDYVKWLGIKTARHRDADRHALGRQPAEGAFGALAGDRSRPPDPRRTDARHRRARQAGNHGLRGQLVPQGHVHPVHFVRVAGSAARVRPHGRHARPQGLRRVPPRRAR
jgi:monosaccharide-transporting ATPase